MEMKLGKIPFEQIKNGTKTVELRLNDKKRSSLKIGDIINFSCVCDESLKISTEVVALHKYSSFEELFKTPLLEKSGFAGYSVKSAVECMRSYYTLEDEKRYGVLGIELRLKP